VHLLRSAIRSVRDFFNQSAFLRGKLGSCHGGCWKQPSLPQCAHSLRDARGTLWTWGKGEFGKLGHGDREPRQRPSRLGKGMYGGSPAVMVSCGDQHTLVLTAMGIWSCGLGGYG